MSEHSSIEWTEATWNPVRGCQKISPGCKHCYAQTFSERFRNVPDHPYRHGFEPRLVPGKLLEPLSWTSPRTVFVNSMSDLFQEAVPDDYIAAVAEVMLQTPWHTYQVLTKRSLRLKALLSRRLRAAAMAPHIWWGVSVEDRKHGLPRIDHLRATHAHTRFLSVEPLLEDLGKLDLNGIHWVIVGGESGAGARPMLSSWVDEIQKACEHTNVAFFFKQWGGVRKALNGRTLHGRTYNEMPDRSSAEIPSKAVRHHMIHSLGDLAMRWSPEPLLRIDRQREVA